jgi:hypothetical protein
VPRIELAGSQKKPVESPGHGKAMSVSTVVADAVMESPALDLSIGTP